MILRRNPNKRSEEGGVIQHQKKGGNSRRSSISFPGNKTVIVNLFVVAATVGSYINGSKTTETLSAISLETKEQPRVLLKPVATGAVRQSAPENESCVKSLLENEKAVMVNTSLKNNSTSFRILLHPPTKDKYITRKIQSKGVYEPEMENFISNALPLNVSYAEESDLSNKGQTIRPWALDMGANIGFHSLHMAQRGANVISFEPAPDTFELFKCSAELLGAINKNGNGGSDKTGFRGSGSYAEHARTVGSIKIIHAGASDVDSQGKMLRHPNSPGMTTFGTGSSFPLEELDNNETTKTDMINLLRAEDVLIAQGVPEGRSEFLRLLKIDVEGYELRALRGLNLTKFPFQFLTFEFFPKMLKGSGTEPVDLLILVRDAGYKCDCDKHSGNTRDEMHAWAHGIKTHVNVFCELSN